MSRIYNPSGFARVIKDDINLVLIGVPTLIPVDNIIFSKLLGSSIESELSGSESGKFDDGGGDESIDCDEESFELDEVICDSVSSSFHYLLYFHTHLQNYYHSFPVQNYWKSSIRNFFQSFYILVPLAIPSIKPYSAIRINSFNLAILSPPTTPDFNIIEFVAMAM